MARGGRILAVLALSAMTLCGGRSAAYADGGKGAGNEDIVSGVLSVVGSSTSTGHANQCGAPIGSVEVKSVCRARHDHADHDRSGSERVDSGLLSNVAAWNATGHSNNCGNPNVAVFSDTTCITEDVHHGR
ncbi:hypothetical protein [Streptomyces olivoreticuli]|uniref:hypothetical protein n=1 Tax=Streptomyces olivoreticuli TaxID=68246 RepID=UPI0013C2ECCC|nr:hypothetical protein [Streptomyces olivoreticuli]